MGAAGAVFFAGFRLGAIESVRNLYLEWENSLSARPTRRPQPASPFTLIAGSPPPTPTSARPDATPTPTPLSALGSTSPLTTPASQPFVVVLVDTAIPKKAYDRDWRTNADFLWKQIYADTELRKKVQLQVVIVDMRFGDGSVEFGNAEQKMEFNPKLIILHRSAFDDPKRPDDGSRLARFMSRFSGSDASFLVYSRKGETDEPFAASLAKKAELTNRVYVYQFRKGDPFADDNQVGDFMNRLKKLIDVLRATQPKRDT